MEHTPTPTPDAFRKAPTIDGTRLRLYAGRDIAGRYKILKKLGRGGMGEVWHVLDLKLRVDVALKSVRCVTSDAVEALRREVRTAREVVSPNVCRIFDLVIAEGHEFVSMEFIDGVTLLELLYEKGPLDLSEAHQIASQFLAGLDAIHRAGLVHRDLKPENIMISRVGRVVVMDFGIAKSIAEMSGTISGTPPYMAPEQILGGKVDVRTDIFAAGAVLAEMITPVQDREAREAIWNALREDPPRLPENPLKRVIARAIARNPEQRFPSIASFIRALEETTHLVRKTEERKPYPGLSSFSESDSEYFFGRELELETVIKKIQELHFLAIIGPSGAGKTSFLRAGLIPAIRANWSYVFVQPGDSPLINLGQALAPEFSGDTEAIRKMVRLENINDALWLLHRWCEKHPESLLIVDRFEELFTLNNFEIQTRFAELLGRAVLEADVRVLLAMRDDFLIFCKEHPPLVPIFSDLTALLPLSGAELRTALIQPALLCGYRIEDEALVDEILEGVHKERGALPLMAFAAARLWEKRDQQQGLLTRKAYKEIGGVSGALAQHAEATMELIGIERHAIVREIFRNLVTSKNTRAVRDTEEILSIFQDRKAAEEVLASLINARLVTSFEAPVEEGTEKQRRRVEIIHESLLSVWPRLVRWQTQDAESAQFHDQFHQAAHVWNDRGRPADLLWTGLSYKQFEVWREKYSGGLTSTERAFANAMLNRARTARNKRAIGLVTAFVVLLSILAVIGTFWRNEKVARHEAVSQALHSEASKLLALGRTELDRDPTLALAYAIASLERADTPVARHFAVQALWNGPVAHIMPNLSIRPRFVHFSPNGKWLASGGNAGVRILPSNGTKPIEVEYGFPPAEVHWPRYPQFAPNNDFVVWTAARDPRIVQVWSLSKRKEIRQFQFEGATISLVRGPKLLLITDLTNKTASTLKWGESRIRTWSFDEAEPKIVGHWNQADVGSFDISHDAQQLVYAKDRSIYIRSVGTNVNASDRLVGGHEAQIKKVIFHPDGKKIMSADSKNEIRMWSLSENSKLPIYTAASRDEINDLFINPSGMLFGCTYNDRNRIWQMNGPVDADPLYLKRNVTPYYSYLAFDPFNKYAIVIYNDSLAFWPLNKTYPYVLHGDGNKGAGGISFTPDGKKLVVGFQQGSMWLWQMDDFHAKKQFLWKPSSEMYRMDMHPDGKSLATATNNNGANIITIDDGKARRMPGVGTGAVSFSPDGRTLAAESYGRIRLWNLDTDEVRIINSNYNDDAVVITFSSNDTIFSHHEDGNVYQWDVHTGSRKLVIDGTKTWSALAVAKKNHRIVASLANNESSVDLQKATSELTILDAQTGKTRLITSHGNRLYSVTLDPSGTLLVTGDMDGILRVGSINGEEPHLLFGHKGRITAIAVDPNLKWIASSEGDRAIVRLWPMPKGKPIHTLSHDEFLKKLRSLTNVRIVKDEKSSTGYVVDFEPFQGWEKAPIW